MKGVENNPFIAGSVTYVKYISESVVFTKTAYESEKRTATIEVDKFSATILKTHNDVL